MHLNYWACAPEPGGTSTEPTQHSHGSTRSLKPALCSKGSQRSEKPAPHNRRVTPGLHSWRQALVATKTQHSQNKLISRIIYFKWLKRCRLCQPRVKLTRAALCCHSIDVNVKTMISNKKSINCVWGSVWLLAVFWQAVRKAWASLSSLGFGLSFEFSHFIQQDLEIYNSVIN